MLVNESTPPVNLLRQMIKSQGSIQLKTRGKSMLPGIRPGETLEVARFEFSELLPGQIIAYFRGGEVLAHRIRYRVATGYSTVGDNNILLDEPVTCDEYLGLCISKTTLDGLRVDLSNKGKPLRMYTSLVRNDQVQVYLPTKLTPFFQSTMPAYPNISLSFFENITQINSSVAETLGVSPNGLETEEVLFKTLDTQKKVHLVCLADFGPSRESLISVTRCKAIIRPSFFDFQSGDKDSMPNNLICYLSALVKGYMWE